MERYERYHQFTKASAEEEQFQIDTLVYTMGETAEKILKLFPDNSKDMYTHLLAAFDGYFTPKTTLAHAVVKFNSRSQLPGETNEQYIRELNSLVERCQFGVQKDDNPKHTSLTGMADKRLSLDLQQLPDTELTPQKVINGTCAE